MSLTLAIGGHELGNIAGSYALEWGDLSPMLTAPHEGTVAAADTSFPALDNVVLPVTLTGLLFLPRSSAPSRAFFEVWEV